MKMIFGIGLAAFLFANNLPGEARATVNLSIDLDKPLVSCGVRDRVIMKIAFETPEVPGGFSRPPLNLGLVLDRSGSMGGQKIEDAKRAAIEAVRRLGRSDIFSLTVFDSEPQVLIPAHRLVDPAATIRLIEGIQAGGSTALYGGLTFGSAEIRKYGGSGYTPRIILLSDGLANVGPQAPDDLARLGRALAGEGMTITTVGLGLDYNEDLMTRLAGASDGNSYFARTSSELPKIFAEELGDATALVARNLRVRIEFPPDVVPCAVLGREGSIRGQTVEVELQNLYSNGSKYVLVEAEVPPRNAGTVLPLAEVTLRYDDLIANRSAIGAKTVTLCYSGDREAVERSLNQDVLKESTLTRVSIEKTKAISLSDAGDYQGAAAAMAKNQMLCEEAARRCGDDADLRREAANCETMSVDIHREQGLSNYGRKRTMNEIFIRSNQQRYESR